MTPEFAVELIKTTLVEAVTLAGPLLGVAMLIGLAVSLFQAVTSIHEQTLSFVPKALAVVGAGIVLLPWLLRTLVEFSTQVIMKMPQMAQYRPNGGVMEFPILVWFLVFARAGALITVFPLFSAQTVPVQLRVALGALIAFLSAPFLPPMAAPDSFWSVFGLLFQEGSVGLLLGFVCRLIFFALDLAGGIIATEMGLMLSSNFNPLTSAAIPVPGTILFWLGMMLLLTLNLHHWIIGAFQHTYSLVPIGAAHLSEALLLEVLRGTAGIFRLALVMTAPVMAVSFVITLIFAVLSRAVPQMNVFTESFPVRSLAGMAVFGLTCHLIAQHIENYLRQLPEDLVRVAHLLGT